MLILSCALLLVRLIAALGQLAFPSIDDCNFCADCVVDGPRLPTSADNIAATSWQKDGGYAHIMSPQDASTKALKPNCTVCRGCNVQLTHIDEETIKFGSLSFKHGKGATNSWHFFASRPGIPGRYIVKVFCIPASKDDGFAKLVTCRSSVYSDRIEIMLANQVLAEECGVQDLFPKLWLGPVSAPIPGLGYHVRWHGLWMEEARGATLHAFQTTAMKRTMYQLLVKLNSSQLLAGAVMDLLTVQCDRHAENIFIDQSGQLQFIDQDKSMGVIPRCGYDSLLLPGTRYHSVIRVGYLNSMAATLRKARQQPGFCRGRVDMRVVIDYRCHTPGGIPGEAGVLGTAYPTGIRQCMSSLSSLSVEQIRHKYRFSLPLRAEVLRNRSIDMLEHGFEWTLANGLPANTGHYVAPAQPPCCGLVVEKNVVTCNKCWKPLLPEDIGDGNNLDMSVVSPIHQ